MANLYPKILRRAHANYGATQRGSASAPEDSLDHDNAPYGVQSIEATVSAFSDWDRWGMFAGLFFVACENCDMLG